jgi:hypothetical protein
MSTIHVHRTTNVTPEQYVAVLTDFGPGRSQIFGNSSDDYLKVHHRGVSQADVTEGSGGIWERLHYDWSDPNRVILTTIDSNVWGGASGHTYTFTRQSNGTTGIDVAVIRDGKNLMGRLLGFVLGQSASTFWRRHSKSPSRPSKSGTRSSNTCAQAAQALPTSPLKRLCGSDVMEVLQEQPPAAGLAKSWPYFDFWGKHGPVNLASTSSNRGWSGFVGPIMQRRQSSVSMEDPAIRDQDLRRCPRQ